MPKVLERRLSDEECDNGTRFLKYSLEIAAWHGYIYWIIHIIHLLFINVIGISDDNDQEYFAVSNQNIAMLERYTMTYYL